MVLTSTVTLDLVNKTQSLSYFDGVTLIDVITFSNNSVTLATCSQFALSKSDALLYFGFLKTFNACILTNFPITSTLLKWPLCQFDITETNTGNLHLFYTQTSLGTSVYSIDYAPVSQRMTVSARSQITITLQEYFMMINMLSNYNTQISLN